MELILTLEEVASFLRSESDVVEKLLQSGDLQGSGWGMSGGFQQQRLHPSLRVA